MDRPLIELKLQVVLFRPSLVNDNAGDSDTSNLLESFSDILTEAMKGSFETKMLNKFCLSKSGNHPNNKIRPFSKEIQISKQLGIAIDIVLDEHKA